MQNEKQFNSDRGLGVSILSVLRHLAPEILLRGSFPNDCGALEKFLLSSGCILFSLRKSLMLDTLYSFDICQKGYSICQETQILSISINVCIAMSEYIELKKNH